MKKENFSRFLEIVKRDDTEEFNEFIKSIIDAGEEYSQNDSKFLLCYAAEVGAKNIVDDILLYDNVSPNTYDFYALRVARLKGYKEIANSLNTDKKINIEALDKEKIINFSKKVIELGEKYEKKLTEIKESTRLLLINSIYE